MRLSPSVRQPCSRMRRVRSAAPLARSAPSALSDPIPKAWMGARRSVGSSSPTLRAQRRRSSTRTQGSGCRGRG
eukprot:3159175-Alexandrium_andersonii.AAC.1